MASKSGKLLQYINYREYTGGKQHELGSGWCSRGLPAPLKAFCSGFITDGQPAVSPKRCAEVITLRSTLCVLACPSCRDEGDRHGWTARRGQVNAAQSYLAARHGRDGSAAEP